MDTGIAHDRQPDRKHGTPEQLLTPARPPILAEAEVARRMLLLAELQAALARLDVHSVLARNHRLVLQYNFSPTAPSGLTNPQLHILGEDRTHVAATDGSAYSLASGQQYPAGDPAEAAEAIARRLFAPTNLSAKPAPQ